MYIGDKVLFAPFLWLSWLLYLLLFSRAQPLDSDHSITGKDDAELDLINVGEAGTGHSLSHFDKDDFMVVQVPDSLRAKVAMPEWVEDWKSIEYVGLRSMYGKAPMFADHANDTVKVAAWLYSMTSGKWLADTHELAKREDRDVLLNEVIQYYDSGEQSDIATSLTLLAKRVDYFHFWNKRDEWKRSKRHIAKLSAIHSVHDLVPSNSGRWFHLRRSAVCARNDDNDQACVSWQGGRQSIQDWAFRNMIEGAWRKYGENEDLSVRCEDCGYLGEPNEREISDLRRVDMCLSNRPNGC